MKIVRDLAMSSRDKRFWAVVRGLQGSLYRVPLEGQSEGSQSKPMIVMRRSYQQYWSDKRPQQLQKLALLLFWPRPMILWPWQLSLWLLLLAAAAALTPRLVLASWSWSLPFHWVNYLYHSLLKRLDNVWANSWKKLEPNTLDRIWKILEIQMPDNVKHTEPWHRKIWERS